jgi:hypothetical protein
MNCPSWAKDQLLMVALPHCLKGVGGTPGLGHHMLRDLVVDVPRPPHLFAPALPGAAFDGRRVLPLELGARRALPDATSLIRPETVQIETRRSAVRQDSIRSS